MRELDIAATAVNIFDGMQVSGNHARWDELVGEAWGGGFIELSLWIGEVAIFINDELEEMQPQDFPGVFDYDVSCVFGEWFAAYMLKNRKFPSKELWQLEVKQLIVEFFKEGGS